MKTPASAAESRPSLAWLLIPIGLLVGWFLVLDTGGSHRTKGGFAEILGLEMETKQYQIDIGSLPPTENPAFFEALAGKNKLNTEYMQLKHRPRDSKGQYLDPWGQPYWIEVSKGALKVHSPTLDRNPMAN